MTRGGPPCYFTIVKLYPLKGVPAARGGEETLFRDRREASGLKSVGKRLLAGAILGAAELGAAGLLSNVGKLASFQDITFFLGIFTLLFGGMMLFHTMRVKAGAPTSASNSNAQGAFAAQVAFEEAKAMEKLRDSSKGRELAAAPGAIAFFAAAAVVLAGFGVSLAL